MERVENKGFRKAWCHRKCPDVIRSWHQEGTTLVVLVGEFGRAPKISKGAKRIGRNHWPACYSAMLAGAGIRGGAVYGESDKHAGYVKTNPVTLPDFTATLFSALNINPASRLSPDGFTIPASEGRAIEALF